MATKTRLLVGRSARKHRAIIKAARTTFLAKGYDDTSVDEIAAIAAVSKPTIYKHFGDKVGLFGATIATAIAEAKSHTQATIEALPATRNLEGDLRRFARQHLAEVMQPHLLRMRRRLIAEAERFPQLAATWYRNGPEKGHETLAAVFSALAARGLLQIDDALVAAEQFNWLVLQARPRPGSRPGRGHLPCCLWIQEPRNSGRLCIRRPVLSETRVTLETSS